MVLVRYESKEWVVIDQEQRNNSDLYLDGRQKEKLDYAKRQQALDNDVWGLVVGKEGSGKSTAASTMMMYMSNNTFDPLKHIIKDFDHALEILMSIPDEGAVMFDEGYLLFGSGDVLTKKQKNLQKIVSIIRQKRLFVLIVAPSFFRIGTYWALDRTKFLMQVYVVEEERGFFRWWGEEGKWKLFTKGKKFHSYKSQRCLFSGRFTKCKLLDEAYKKIKRDTLKEAFKDAQESKRSKPSATNQHTSRVVFYKEFIARNHKTMKQTEMARLLGIHPVTLNRHYKEVEKFL